MFKPPAEQTRWSYFLFLLEQIDNLGFKEFPVNVSLTIPTQLEHSFEMINYGVTVAQVRWRLPPNRLHLMRPKVSQAMIVVFPFFKRTKLNVRKRPRWILR